MDKNIAALLREDARTVRVVFESVASDFDEDEPTNPASPSRTSARRGRPFYTYVTDLTLVKNDTVIVEAGDAIRMAYVVEVDDEVCIEPNSTTQIKWVIDKIDMAAHAARVLRNQAIESAVSDSYRQNLRRGFRQQMLAGVDDAQRATILQLTGAKE
jgi:hypothetical protein